MITEEVLKEIGIATENLQAFVEAIRLGVPTVTMRDGRTYEVGLSGNTARKTVPMLRQALLALKYVCKEWGIYSEFQSEACIEETNDD